jgi:hypothetical protein
MILAPLGRVAGAYYLDNSRVSVIVGPVGSAKSTASCLRLQRHAYEQKPGSDGIAFSRWAIVRNTSKQLEDTTMKTWFRLFPENVFGQMKRTTRTQVWSFKPKGFDHPIRAEFAFRALDDDADVADLLSLEVTGFYFNEVREISDAILTHAGRRAGRFPSGPDYGVPTWRGWIGDSNMWDTEHHLYDKLVENPREGWRLFHQPGGMDPDAENLENLEQTEETLALPYDDPRRRAQGRKYYEMALSDYGKEDADVYVHAKWGALRDGKPIYTEYADSVHCRPFELVKGIPLRIGYDFGRTPAAVIAQQLPNGGQWRVRDELCGFDIGVKKHGEQLKAMIMRKYPDFEVEAAHGDPSGDAKDDNDLTTFQHLAAAGINCKPASTNDPTTRFEAVNGRFRTLSYGEPGLIIHPDCKMLRKACIDGYHYRKLRVAGNRFDDKPNKNDYSHVAEALQYLLLGGGEARVVLNKRRANPHRQRYAEGM